MASAEDGSQEVQYAVIDAFTNKAFHGNPAAVCLLHDSKDAQWMQQVANEFNLSQTAFLKQRSISSHSQAAEFDLRWFTPLIEVDLCGHATLASAYFLFSSGIGKGNLIFFHTRSGILTAKRIDDTNESKGRVVAGMPERFSVEIILPQSSILNDDCNYCPYLPNTLNGISVQEIKKTSSNDFIIELESGELVRGIEPDFEEIKKCNGRAIIITGPAPKESGFDFFSRVFFGKFGVNEDPVCGSAHCALAPYWAMKLGKTRLVALQVSPRGGKLLLQLDNKNNTVALQGEAVTVMSGVVTVV